MKIKIQLNEKAAYPGLIEEQWDNFVGSLDIAHEVALLLRSSAVFIKDQTLSANDMATACIVRQEYSVSSQLGHSQQTNTAPYSEVWLTDFFEHSFDGGLDVVQILLMILVEQCVSRGSWKVREDFAVKIT